HEVETLGHMILGARPLLARGARCAAPMPPDPVGQLERSRARPPLVLGAGVLARGACCAAPLPPIQWPRGSRRAWLERSRARVPLAVGILQSPPAFPLTRTLRRGG